MTDADASSRSVSERLNIAPRIGFRHGSSVVASAHPYALRIGTKENYVSGGALQSFNFPRHARPPAARTVTVENIEALVRAHGGRRGPNPDDLRAGGARGTSQDAARDARR